MKVEWCGDIYVKKNGHEARSLGHDKGDIFLLKRAVGFILSSDLLLGPNTANKLKIDHLGGLQYEEAGAHLMSKEYR